jgi:hypothetical protein
MMYYCISYLHKCNTVFLKILRGNYLNLIDEFDILYKKNIRVKDKIAKVKAGAMVNISFCTIRME